MISLHLNRELRDLDFLKRNLLNEKEKTGLIASGGILGKRED